METNNENSGKMATDATVKASNTQVNPTAKDVSKSEITDNSKKNFDKDITMDKTPSTTEKPLTKTPVGAQKAGSSADYGTSNKGNSSTNHAAEDKTKHDKAPILDKKTSDSDRMETNAPAGAGKATTTGAFNSPNKMNTMGTHPVTEDKNKSTNSWDKKPTNSNDLNATKPSGLNTGTGTFDATNRGNIQGSHLTNEDKNKPTNTWDKKPANPSDLDKSLPKGTSTNSGTFGSTSKGNVVGSQSKDDSKNKSNTDEKELDKN
jgi:hypothetical protein